MGLALPPTERPLALWIGAAIATSIALIHFICFDGFTIAAALASNDQIQVALIRQNVTTSLPSWMNYASSIAVNGLFPIVLVLAVANQQRRLAFLTGAVGLLYAICLMQKSRPIMLMLPLIAYLVIQRHLIKAIIMTAAVGAVIFFMGFVANPSIRPAAMQTLSEKLEGFAVTTSRTNVSLQLKASPKPIPLPTISSLATQKQIQISETSNTNRLGLLLLYRALITPGEVVGLWFDAIPSEIPFSNGCGYRFLTSLLGCHFQNYSRILYDRLFPTEASMGLEGTINAASMMTAYANFGWIELAIIEVIHAIVAWALMVIFIRNKSLAIPINLTFILLLSSGDIFTMLLSGGWGLAILLFAMLGRNAEPIYSLSDCRRGPLPSISRAVHSITRRYPARRGARAEQAIAASPSSRLDRNDGGQSRLLDVDFGADRNCLQGNRHMQGSRQIWIVEPIGIANEFIRNEFKVFPAKRMLVPGREIRERHFGEFSADAQLQLMDFACEAIGRQPFGHRAGIEKRSVDFLGLGREYAMQPDSVR